MDLPTGSIIGAKELRDIHRDFYKGIYVPAGEDVAYSIRFRPRRNEDYGYSDRWVEPGRVLDYTGQGPPPGDQTWNRFNLGLRNAHDRGTGVHVFEELGGSPRSYKYWGCWKVTLVSEVRNEIQGRRLLRFQLEA
jgi:SAD/SRA domain-containing protein